MDLKSIKYDASFFLIFIAVAFIAISCKKDKEIVTVDLGYDYFPDIKGNFIILV